MEFDDGIFEAKPFCGIAKLEVGGNDGRGDIRDVGSFDGETLRDDGPPML